MNNKRDGTTYEAKFVVECLERDLEPHHTTGDYLPHDILVSNKAGGIYRVQVKGTGYAHRRGVTTRYRISAGAGVKKDSLDCSKVDCLACTVPGGAWYIIPCLKLRGRAVWLYPNPSKSYYEQFLNNWDFFLT